MGFGAKIYSIEPRKLLYGVQKQNHLVPVSALNNNLVLTLGINVNSFSAIIAIEGI